MDEKSRRYKYNFSMNLTKMYTGYVYSILLGIELQGICSFLELVWILYYKKNSASCFWFPVKALAGNGYKPHFKIYIENNTLGTFYIQRTCNESFILKNKSCSGEKYVGNVAIRVN